MAHSVQKAGYTKGTDRRGLSAAAGGGAGAARDRDGAGRRRDDKRRERMRVRPDAHHGHGQGCGARAPRDRHARARGGLRRLRRGRHNLHLPSDGLSALKGSGVPRVHPRQERGGLWAQLRGAGRAQGRGHHAGDNRGLRNNRRGGGTLRPNARDRHGDNRPPRVQIRRGAGGGGGDRLPPERRHLSKLESRGRGHGAQACVRGRGRERRDAAPICRPCRRGHGGGRDAPDGGEPLPCAHGAEKAGG